MNDDSTPAERHNCWTCRYANWSATDCRAVWSDALRDWLRSNGMPFDEQCPPEADGCPSWAAKEIP